jgi:NAD(P)-dependent dehydrogenase (short-subunit alcohol dehydrogenase family)
MDLHLKDKVVVLNAATGGIGKAIVKAFYEEGAKLAISSTKQEKVDALIASEGYDTDRVKGFQCDAADEASVKAFVDGAAAAFGGIDVAMPIAGYEGSYAPIEESDAAEFQKVYNINVFGPMFMVKYAAPYLVKRGKGAVVVLASDGSFIGAPGMSAYCSSKHAVAGLVKSFSMELGPKGIHCNYIAPGAVDTPMMRRIEKKTFGDTKTPEEAERIFADAYFDKRYCKPEEVAAAALFLASDVSAHMMSEAIRLDAGLGSTSR